MRGWWIKSYWNLSDASLCLTNCCVGKTETRSVYHCIIRLRIFWLGHGNIHDSSKIYLLFWICILSNEVVRYLTKINHLYNLQSDVKSVKMISAWVRHNEAESAWLPDCFLSSYEVISRDQIPVTLLSSSSDTSAIPAEKIKITMVWNILELLRKWVWSLTIYVSLLLVYLPQCQTSYKN